MALAAVVGAGIAVVVLINSGDELLAAGDELTAVSAPWVLVAVVAEVASYLARGAAEAVVLRRGTQPDAPRAGVTVLSAATLAGDAAAYCLPFGFAASGVVTVRALTRRGVGAAIATWTFAVSQMFYVGSVAVLTLVAVEIAGDADPIPGLGAASLGLIVVLAVVGLLVVAGRRSHAVRSVGRSVRDATVGRVRSRTAGRVARWWRAQTSQLRSVRLSAGAGFAVLAWMLVSWLTDIAVLGIAYEALGASPPWLGLLLAYCAGQVAAALPVTPGGIGAVEGSLTLALVAFGGAETITLAAVLLYRLIAYWGCIPVGGVAWAVLRATAPERRSSERTPATLAGSTERGAA